MRSNTRAEAAKRLGRSLQSITARRMKLGVPDGRKVKYRSVPRGWKLDGERVGWKPSPEHLAKMNAARGRGAK